MKINPHDHIKILKAIAISKGGKLLSNKYLGGRVKLKFKDAGGNIFYTTPEQIKLGTWSPHEGQVAEPSCRQAMNHLFNTKFEKTNSILTAKILQRKRPLELDGYCNELNIAFEYQGYPLHWKKTHRNYETTTTRDKIKQKKCKQINIDLIIIHPLKEVKNKWKSDNILNHVMEAVNNFYKKNKKPVPSLNKNNFKLDLSKNNHCLKMLTKLRNIAIANKGMLISKKWNGSEAKYRFESSDGTRFSMIGNNMLNKNRGWPKDIKQLTKTSKDYLQELRDVASLNGGQLLSKKWLGNLKYHKFLFQDGREFRCTAATIRLSGWPVGKSCLFNGPDEYFTELKNLAKESGFKVLEKQWLVNDIKHRFLTPCKREIQMAPNKVKTEGFIKDLDLYFKTPEQWLDDLKQIADENQGTLLEDQWLGNEVPHRFKFKDGRETTFKPNRLKSKGWPQDLDNYFSQKSVVWMTDLDKLNRIKNIAKENGGQLLDNKWLGYATNHKFLFQDGQAFEMKPTIILANGWPKGETTLFYNDNDYLNELKIIAESNGGKLLDTKWLGNRSSYRFQFEDGREFSIVPASLKNRGWPKNPDLYFNQINGKNKTDDEKIEFINQFAIKNKGKFLDDQWIGTRGIYNFEFQDGRKFKLHYVGVKNNEWPKNPNLYFKRIAEKSRTYGDRLKEINELAASKGGKILESKILGTEIKHKCQLEDGRIFETTPYILLTSGWPKNPRFVLQHSTE